jgi:hypothetical protein
VAVRNGCGIVVSYARPLESMAPSVTEKSAPVKTKWSSPCLPFSSLRDTVPRAPQILLMTPSLYMAIVMELMPVEAGR